MKKIIISMMAAMMSVFSFAADQAVARITLTGTTSGGQAQLVLIENSSYSAGYDNGYDAPCNINLAEDLPKTLHIYSYIGANKYSTIATNNLDGLHVDFITNLVDDEYTMTFEVFTLVAPRTLDIYDMTSGTRTEISASESYTFTAAKGHNEIKDRFVINYVAPSYVTTVETNAYGLATFSYNQNLVAVESEVKLYKGAINGEYLDLTTMNYVKADEGVIVYGEANTTYHFAAGTGTSDFSDNELVAASAWTYPYANKDVYVLSGNMLHLYEGDVMKPNKAFLLLAKSSANPAPKHISMRFKTATGVENVQGEDTQCTKFMENGQVFIRRGNEVYNLQGQIVK